MTLLERKLIPKSIRMKST